MPLGAVHSNSKNTAESAANVTCDSRDAGTRRRDGPRLATARGHRYAGTMSRLRILLPLLALLASALALAVWSTTPPAVVPADAAVTRFSAARAMAVVELLSKRPHPVGSPEAAAVRAALTARLRALGLIVTAQPGVGTGMSSGANPSARAARVENLVAVLPGADRALPAVAIMVHTDSVPGSFGAADDGIGVAVALETVRAITSEGRPARDVMLIMTDGEEAGLLGARLFFADKARAARVAAVINVDSRGTAGLGTMFETGPGSGGLVSLYRRHATNRFAHSAATFLYHQLPNSTDLTATRGLDIPALNFAFLDGEFDYHTPRDHIASIDPRTVQSLGDQVLPVVRAVARDPVPLARGADGVFGDAAFIVAMRYPAWVGWPLLIVAAALAGLAVRGAAPGPTLRAAAATLWIAVAAALAVRAGYALTGVGDDWGEHHRIMAAFGRYEAALGLFALAVVLVAAVALRRGGLRWPIVTACGLAGAVALLLGQPPLGVAILALLAGLLALFAFARQVGAIELRAGTLAVGLLLSLALQILAPPLTLLPLWATLAAAAGAVAERGIPGGRWIAAVVAVLPFAYLLVFGHAVLLALGIPTPEAVAVFALCAALLLLPLAEGPIGGVVAAGFALVATALLLAFRWSAPTERHPALSQIYAVKDAAGRSWRMSPLERPDDWTMRALRADGGAVARATLSLISEDPVWRAPARPIALPPPATRVTLGQGWTTLRVAPGSGGRTLRLALEVDRALGQVSVEGVALPGFAAKPGTWRLRWQSSGDPVTLRFRAPRGTRLIVTAGEWTERRLALPARPATIVPWLGSDRVIVMSKAAWRLK